MDGGWSPLSDASSWNPNEVQEEELPKEEMKARNKQNLLSMHIFGHILCSMHMEFALEHNVTYQLMFYCIPVPSVFFFCPCLFPGHAWRDLSRPMLKIFQLGWLESTMCTSTWRGECCVVLFSYTCLFHLVDVASINQAGVDAISTQALISSPYWTQVSWTWIDWIWMWNE